MQSLDRSKKIYVAGHRGMVGSAIIRELEKQGYTNVINAGGVLDYTGELTK